jgi:carboxyl-terminal processing protease
VSEKMLNSLKTQATKEKQFTEIQAEYDALKGQNGQQQKKRPAIA